MSKDDTLEIDAIIEKSSRLDSVIGVDRTDYNIDGFQTHTGVFDPQGTGKYNISVNGQVLTVQVNEANSIPDSGVARWKFDQDVTDSWGSNDGTDNTSDGYDANSALGTHAKVFDGSNDYVSQPLTSLFDGSSDFSISFWVNPKSINNTYYFGWYDGNTYTIQIGGAEVRFGEVGGNEHRIQYPLVKNTWQHIVWTFESSVPESTIYIDGSEYDSTTSLVSTATNPVPDIGRRANTNDRYWDGKLDDGRIYNKPLRLTEVSNLYNNNSIQ